MCNKWCNDFVFDVLSGIIVKSVKTISVLEVGSRNVNGSPRDMIAKLPIQDLNYIGLDLEDGPGVDVVENIETLSYWDNAFDVVVCTETIEHVHDWRKAIISMAKVLRTNGLIILTTCAPGFEYHPYPEDNWRFTLGNLSNIFNHEPFVVECAKLGGELRRDRPNGLGVAACRLYGQLNDWTRYLDHIDVMDVHKNIDQIE